MNLWILLDVVNFFNVIFYYNNVDIWFLDIDLLGNDFLRVLEILYKLIVIKRLNFSGNKI